MTVVATWLVLSTGGVSVRAQSAGANSAAPSVVVAARATQPGELIVFTVRAPGEAIGMAVDLFGRRATGFVLADGRWRAVVGIDLDQKPGPYTATIDVLLPARTARVTRSIVVKPKEFATRTLTVSPEFVNPPASQQERIAAESAFLRRIFAASAPTRLWTRSFTRPVPDAANSRFGTRSIFNGERRNPHGGADFASPLGRPVKAPNGGRVVAARELFFAGNVVILDHGLGMFSMLAHLSRIDVAEGDEVKTGQVVGLVGATGRVTGAHLHWSLTVAGARVDPLSALVLLGDGGARTRK
jgi:murein DD-endopeptidase MepM/ murein hydrolase activator NlpD